MLSLTIRAARFNQDYRGKTQEKDGQVTKKLVFGLEDVGLTETDLGAFTGDAHAYRSLYNFGGAQPEPMHPYFKAFAFHEDIESAQVNVRLHGGSEYKFSKCKITKIKLKPSAGGLTLLSCKVEAEPALNESLAELVANFGEVIDVELYATQESDQVDAFKGAQPNAEDPPADKPKRGRPRKGEARVN